MCADYCTTKVVCHANPKFRVPIVEDDRIKDGYFRDACRDSELFWFFGFSWWEHVTPLLDENGVLSVQQIQKVLEMLKSRERIFEFNLAEFPINEQERLRQRYLLVVKFFSQAIEQNAPVDVRF